MACRFPQEGSAGVLDLSFSALRAFQRRSVLTFDSRHGVLHDPEIQALRDVFAQHVEGKFKDNNRLSSAPTLLWRLVRGWCRSRPRFALGCLLAQRMIS